jgi:preprotein translocase subunit SecB
LSQYVKDLSFENPNSPAVYQWQSQPQIDVQFNIGSQQLNETSMRSRSRSTSPPVPRTTRRSRSSCSMPACSRFGTSRRAAPAVPARRAPRLIFPFARRVIADCVRDGGFPPLMLDPIDFASLYMQRAAQMGGEAGGITTGEIGQA